MDFYKANFGWSVIRGITAGFDGLVPKHWIRNGNWWANVSPKSHICMKYATVVILTFWVNLACPCVSLTYFIAFKFQERHHTWQEYFGANKCFLSKWQK